MAVLYLVAGGVLLDAPAGTARHDAARRRAARDRGGRRLVRRSSSARGSRYVRAHPIVRWALLYLGIAASIVGILGVLGPAFAEDVPGPAHQGLRRRRAPARDRRRRRRHVAVNVLQPLVSRRRLIESGMIVLGVSLAG